LNVNGYQEEGRLKKGNEEQMNQEEHQMIQNEELQNQEEEQKTLILNFQIHPKILNRKD